MTCRPLPLPPPLPSTPGAVQALFCRTLPRPPSLSLPAVAQATAPCRRSFGCHPQPALSLLHSVDRSPKTPPSKPQTPSHTSSSVDTAWSAFTLCWAKCLGYPYWPGVIVKLLPRQMLACVAFYDGQGDVAEAQWFKTDDAAMQDYASNRHKSAHIPTAFLFYSFCFDSSVTPPPPISQTLLAE
jgi:hypothetical protein